MPTNPSTEPAQLEAECRRLKEALALAQREHELLGYEIHDGVVQDLAAAAMLLEGAGRQAQFASPEVAQRFASGLKLLQDSIAAARRIIRGATATDIEAGGLVVALSRLVEKFKSDHALPVTFTSEVEEPKLPAAAQHALVRIAQESLHNAAKHARATEVQVSLRQRDGKLEMVIADNGIGFDPGQVPDGHFGLAGIRARAGVLGADLVLDTAPNHGTRVIVLLTPPAL
jgi:signal transduction histidine kinase